MSKDHTPGGFDRENGYKSDLEIAETGPMVKSINTSFGGQSHNAYIMRKDGTHEHFFYSPETGKSGWHGNNWETKNNHPKAEMKGEEKPMERNSFLERIKVDQSTIDKCNEASRKAAENQNKDSGKKSFEDDGGRERGDEGPGSKGREPGNKSSPAKDGSNGGHESSGNGGSGGGHGGSGASGGGHGGNGGSGGGHGGNGGSGGGHGGNGGSGGGHGGNGGSGGGHGGH